MGLRAPGVSVANRTPKSLLAWATVPSRKAMLTLLRICAGFAGLEVRNLVWDVGLRC